MIAELLAVGTELLLGEIVDTNTAWLADDLAERGVDVYWSRRVGDNRARVAEALREAMARSDLVVTVGGLGPTLDDLTREAIADALGEVPEVDAAQEQALRDWFAGRGQPMPEMNVKQAWCLPSGALLPNPLGTAPGWMIRKNERIIVALPGPPREMTRMWREEAVPRVGFPPSPFWRRTLKIWGLGESRVAELLGDWTESANPSVATYSKADGIHVRVAARGRTPEEAETLARPAVAAVTETFGERVWGSDADTTGDVVRRLLLQRGATLASLESLTGGMLGNELASVPGISEVYRGGGISYTADAKVKFGVSADTVARVGTVAAQTAGEMALAAARWFGADYGVATTGVAGPATWEGKPVGTVFIGLHGPLGTRTRALDFGVRSRDQIRERTVFAALQLLRKALIAQETSPEMV